MESMSATPTQQPFSEMRVKAPFSLLEVQFAKEYHYCYLFNHSTYLLAYDMTTHQGGKPNDKKESNEIFI